MSEGDVSLIRDEDLLRRMWQQTEDFSRKKEIRAHMYRLREERLRNLYSPEPKHEGKGSEFTAAQDHVKSFADQSFQSMKSKEVRDAGSPPKEFTYRGQDLKALSNAGWNVESENKTTDDGHTHVKSVHANIEGRYDVDGGKGQFAAVDHHKEAVTEYHDANSSLKRNETSSNTAAREHVVRQTDDGTHISSTTSSSTSSSKFQQSSSTRHESVPYVTNDDYDLRTYDTNRNEDNSLTRRQITRTNDYEQNLRSNERRNDYEQTVRRSDYETGELVSRKVDYPDDNTRVIVETRCLPDGTRVTSTKREFRAPVQSTRSEQSYQTRSENRSYSTQQRSDIRDSSSKVIRHVIDNRDDRSTNIVDSQRNVDDYDFKRQIADYTKDSDDYSNKHYETKVNRKVIDHSKADDDYSVQRVTKINRTVVDHAKTDDDYSNVQRYETKTNKRVVDHSKTDDDYSNTQRYHTTINKRVIDDSKTDNDYTNVQRHERINQRVVDSKTNDDCQTTRHVTRTHKVIQSTDNDDVQTHRDVTQRRYVTHDDQRDVVTTRDERVVQPKDNRDAPQTRDVPTRDAPGREAPRGDAPGRDTPGKDAPSRDTPGRYAPSRDGPGSDGPGRYTPGRDAPGHYTPGKHTPGSDAPAHDTPSRYAPTRDSPSRDAPGRDVPRTSEERIHHITRDKKVEEVVEKKTNTEQHQTTYQTDYSQKKISNDWSPSHTAWASTLRADTPSTTRPSTRASSPGSKTFRSSTSSLRSSVSPDKTYRKPSSRGGSPSKIDRSSPTRSVSDRHSTTHSTHSVTEVKSHRYTTPDDRRPPTGRSPTRPGYSPERRPQDHRQRPSTSPEKRPQDLSFRPSSSPDRKTILRTPTDGQPRVGSPTRPVDRRESPTRPRESPERKPGQQVTNVTGYPSSPSRASPEKTTDRHPKDTRPSQSPDRKPSQQKPSDGRPGSVSDLPRTTSPTRPSPSDGSRKPGTSPDRKPGYPGSPSDKPSDKQPKDSSAPTRGSVSPDRKPGYMRPTATSQPSDDLKSPTKPSDRSSPTKQAPSTSPTRKSQDHTTTTSKIQEDHYKFIDEETKMYTRVDKTRPDQPKETTAPRQPALKDRSPSPTKKAPIKDTDDVNKVPRRSPSPQHVTVTEKHDRIDTTVKTTDVTDNVTATHRTPKDKDAPTPDDKPREPSPSKFGTYDKKKKSHTEITEVTTTDTKDVRYDSLTRRDKSPKKSPEQPTSPLKKAPEQPESPTKKAPEQPSSTTKKVPEQPGSPTKKAPEQPLSPMKKFPEQPGSPTKKAPRDSVSPVKSPTKDTKYKHTTDFLATERTTEEVNKKTTKEHPRQLVTPSSSPTKKPKKPTDTEPSTGQSSPTTSVSGFVYFSSPRTERTIVTDLDDHETYTEHTETHTVDETTSYKRPESLDVKRSPSPSKIPCRSPSPEKHVPSKDSLPRKSSLKKPTTEITQASPVEKPPSSFRVSPTEEPKDFPEHKVVKKDRPEGPEKAPMKVKPPLERRETYEDRCRKILGMTDDTTETVKKTTYLKEPETNLSSPSISPCRSPAPKETPFEYPTTKKVTNTKVDVTDFIAREQENIIKTTRVDEPTDKKPKTPRDSSPTKLQDIITTKKTVVEETLDDVEKTSLKKTTTKYPSPRQSPERKPSYQPSEDAPSKTPKDKPKSVESPEQQKPDVRSTSPAKLHPGSSPRSSLSPETKPGYEPKEKKPSEPLDKTPGYMKTTTTVSSKYDTAKDTEEITVTTKTERKPSRSSESPTRKTPGDTSRPTYPTDKSPQRKPESKKPGDNYPRQTSPTRPVYLESTTSMVAEYGSTEDIEELVTKTTSTKRTPTQPSKSPTRKPSKPDDSPTKPGQPADKSPTRKPSHETSRASPEKKPADKPKDTSPTRPGYTKSTTTTTKRDSTTEDHVTSVSETTKTKTYRISESPTRKAPKKPDDSATKPGRPSDVSPDRRPSHGREPSPTKASPTKKPGDKHPKDSPVHGKPDKIPGYMKTTESVSSKYESEDVEEFTTSKTERHHTTRSDSPTHKTPKSEDHPRRSSSSRPHDTDKVRRPSHEPSPTKGTPERQTDKHPKDKSHPHSEKTPHYMQPITHHRHVHETVQVEEDYEVRTSTVEHSAPLRSHSPTQKEKTPHYMRPISPHHHTDTQSIEDQIVPHKTTVEHSAPLRSHSPTHKDKSPHYMRPISPHRHTPTEVVEDEFVSRKTYTVQSAQQRSHSPTGKDKTPHYMRPISPHRHTETESIEDEIIARKTSVEHSAPHRSRSPTDKDEIPHYMRPISPHRHREVEPVEDEYVSRKTTVEHSAPRSHSPTHQRLKEEVPHYMTPITHHRHIHETEVIGDEQVTRTHTHDSLTRKSITEKTPHYMTPISSHVHTHETEITEYEVGTLEEKHPSPQYVDSPTRRPSKPGDKSPESDHPRTGSPSKRPSDRKESLERKPGYQQPSESTRKPVDKHPKETSPSRRTKSPDTPGYMRSTTAVTSKHDTTEDFEETTVTQTVHSKHPSRPSESPTRRPSKPDDSTKKPSYKDGSPDRKLRPQESSPSRKSRPEESSPRASPERRPSDRYPKEPSPTRQTPSDKTPGYMKKTTSVTSKYDSTTEDVEEHVTSKTTERHRQPTRPTESSPTRKTPKQTDRPRTESPTKPRPDGATKKPSTPLDTQKPEDKRPQDSSPTRTASSPDRKPGYMRPTASVTTKHETTTTEDVEIFEVRKGRTSPRSSVSPPRRSPDEPSRSKPGYLREPEEPRQLRTPSPTKKTTKVTEVSTDFIMSEREQEVLDRVQKSLRKLSPDRKEKSPSRERSPGKTTTSLQDLDITTHTVKDSEIITEEVTEFTEKHAAKIDISRPGKPKDEKPKDQKVPSKPSSRNVSPTKKPSGIVSPTKIDKSTDSKPRSISPKKPVSPTERPQSPQVPKASGIKPKEQIPSHLTRKPTPATLTVTKVDKTVTDLKRTGVTTKQNSFTKTTTTKTTGKVIQSPTGKPSERAPTPKGIRESGIPKKDDTKVTRTVSDITLKSKKTSPTSPQRVKSKPDIQVNDMSPTKTPGKQKSSLKEPQSKLPSKPKSATTLNTPSDEDDIIIDMQQSKSSRENSPDRICPTPVNFDDMGTPRYPDEVKEPDDEFRRRTYHTIHEAESIVDDIVEICEDDELFVRKTDEQHLTEEDESLLSVTDKVSRFTKGIDTTTKPKDTTSSFKDTERRVHSDFVEENLKSDECLLSVSEKVNKFAKGPRDTKDKSPARSVVDEYDKNTVYIDDYTKLSVHDKAHMFVETAENVKAPKVKPAPQKVERPDLTNVDEALKSDDCLLSVSDKVHKFVKTAEQFLTETQEVEEKERKIKEQHERIMKKIVDDDDDDEGYEVETTEEVVVTRTKTPEVRVDKPKDKPTREPTSHTKVKDYSSPNKPTERTPTMKITTLRSSEAVKKAKALFENIATTQKKETTHTKATTKLTDIGVMKKSPKTDSTTVLHPSTEEGSPNITDVDSEIDVAPHQPKERPTSGTPRPQHLRPDDKPRASPTRLSVQSPDGRRSKSPMRHTVETTTTTKTVVTKYPATTRAESPMHRPESDKPDKVPGYLRPTKTSQIKEETKVVEEAEVSSRRGSGKFGVELRRTSVERSTASSERRRSVEHPCIEDIFDLDLLEQMLEKVVGYEQRRRIRAQIRIARKKSETDHVDSTHTRTTKQTVTTTTQKARTPDRHQTSSPDRTPKSAPHKTASPDRHAKTPQRTIPERSQPREQVQPVLNGHAKEPTKTLTDKRTRPQSPEKPAPKSVLKTKSPVRQASPDKKTRTQSPIKTATPKPKANRFNEYASAYMKKVGLSEADKLKFAESKKKATEDKQRTVKQVEEHQTVEEYSTAKTFTERTSSKDVIEIVQMNGSKRSPSPEKRLSPERKAQSPERIYERTPSPVQKQPLQQTKSEPTKKETIIKTVYDIEKKIPQKPAQEEKPSWVTNRNLKKITSETRTYSSKKIEEKPKYRAPSPSKVITKPIDVITSSYGPGPLDAEGKPLFGIRALRNGASNYQVKGTVIRSEYHSRNGGEPEGTVSVTAYSTEPEELERLLQRQGDPPSRIHGLAAITTTKKFGGETGTTLKEIHGKEERAAIDQFTHSDRRVSDTRIEDITESFGRQEVLGETRRVETRREEIVGDIIRDRTERTDKMEKTDRVQKKVERKGDRVEKKERPDDKKTVRQSSVKSLTEKYIKSANESSKAERTTYPKAGLILRTTTMKDSVSSDSSAHAGLTRTDSEHSLGSVEDTVVTTERVDGGVRTITTTTRSHGHVTHGVTHGQVTQVKDRQSDRSFLDSNTKVTGVQDILTRMKNADIVIQEGDSSEDTEARALLNKFLGATVLMAGMQSYVTEKPSGKVTVKQETVRTSSSGGGKVTSSQSRSVQEFDIDQCWDERLLRKLLDECNDYEQRRRLRARIRTLMAEQEACASAVTEALAAAGETPEDSNEAREEEEVTVTSSVRRNSSEKTVSSSTTTTKTSKVIESMTRPAPKPVSPFAKFRQLEKQNSTNSPNSASPKSPGSPAPYFKFTEPALQASAATIKERLLQWCRDKTRDYENVKLENFSTSWADGLAFCALLHHFLPDTFDYSKLSADTRRHNFTLAFKLADEKAGIYPLLDVDDMVAMRKPDWKCVFTYVQSIYRRFKDQD
ncbi:uncharacterized protein LOC142977753 isoform X1 [Anticarsia gemmatalis]|uniref:uncharacterized protein LOC142977753 isoform X1 n=1 Tax=Anticarsia gemmatalis TaxID=129554 RepID=UPI003F76F471